MGARPDYRSPTLYRGKTQSWRCWAVGNLVFTEDTLSSGFVVDFSHVPDEDGGAVKRAKSLYQAKKSEGFAPRRSRAHAR